MCHKQISANYRSSFELSGGAAWSYNVIWRGLFFIQRYHCRQQPIVKAARFKQYFCNSRLIPCLLPIHLQYWYTYSNRKGASLFPKRFRQLSSLTVKKTHKKLTSSAVCLITASSPLDTSSITMTPLLNSRNLRGSLSRSNCRQASTRSSGESS